MPIYKVLKDFPSRNATRQYKSGKLAHFDDNSRTKALVEMGYLKKNESDSPQVRPKTVWDLKVSDECWMRATSDCAIFSTPVRPKKVVWTGSVSQVSLREIGGLFLTEEGCKKDIEWQRAKQTLLRDTKRFEPDWKSGEYDKYEVAYEHSDEDYDGEGLFVSHCNHCSTHNDLWFASAEDAEASIKAHAKEWKIYLGIEE